MGTEEMRIAPSESLARLSAIDEAHRMLDEADWPQGRLVARIKRLARALNDFREVADDPSRSGLFRSLEKTSAALRRERAEKQELLERAQRAEAALQGAAAREAAIHQRAIIDASDGVGDFLSCMFCGAYCNPGETVKHETDCPLVHPSPAAGALLERLAELEALPQQLENLSVATTVLSERLERAETKAEDLHGALQAALTPLEAAEAALVPPGARVEEAAALIEDAIVVIREELNSG